MPHVWSAGKTAFVCNLTFQAVLQVRNLFALAISSVANGVVKRQRTLENFSEVLVQKVVRPYYV